jgi:hypothetical protein
MKISNWKYKPSPFNILAIIFGVNVIMYFVHANKGEYYDRYGWIAVSVLLPSIACTIVLLIFDYIIQLRINLKKYYWVIIIEILLAGLLIGSNWPMIHAMFRGL